MRAVGEVDVIGGLLVGRQGEFHWEVVGRQWQVYWTSQVCSDFIFESPFFFYTICSFFIPCQHSLFLFPRVVPPRGGNGNIVLSHNG